MRPKGSILPAGPLKWRIVADAPRSPGGKRRQCWRTVHGSRRDADRALRALVTELEEQEQARKDPSVAAFLAEWLGQARRRVSPGTYRSYSVAAQRATTHLGALRLSQLTTRDLQAHFNALADAGMAPSTLATYRGILRIALRVAARWKLATAAEIAHTELPRKERAARRFLTEEETRRLLGVTQGTPLHAPVLLAATCGLRLGEVLALRWADVDFEARTLTVRRSLDPQGAEGPPKGRKAADVALPAFVAAALQAHQQEQQERRHSLGPAWSDGDLVCDGGTGLPLPRTTLRVAFNAACARAGLPKIRFHDLRGSHGSQLLQAGVPIPVVSERLRHSDVATTLRHYTAVLPGRATEAAGVTDRLLNGGPERNG